MLPSWVDFSHRGISKGFLGFRGLLSPVPILFIREGLTPYKPLLDS